MWFMECLWASFGNNQQARCEGTNQWGPQPCSAQGNCTHRWTALTSSPRRPRLCCCCWPWKPQCSLSRTSAPSPPSFPCPQISGSSRRGSILCCRRQIARSAWCNPSPIWRRWIVKVIAAAQTHYIPPVPNITSRLYQAPLAEVSQLHTFTFGEMANNLVKVEGVKWVS